MKTGLTDSWGSLLSSAFERVGQFPHGHSFLELMVWGLHAGEGR